ELEDHAARNNGCADSRNNKERLPAERGAVVIDASRRTHETKDVERSKGKDETNKPAPKCPASIFFIQAESEYFREPIGEASEVSKEHATYNHRVEVCDQEKTIVQLEVCRRHCHDNACNTTERKQHDKSHKPEHWCRKANTAAIHG